MQKPFAVSLNFFGHILIVYALTSYAKTIYCFSIFFYFRCIFFNVSKVFLKTNFYFDVFSSEERFKKATATTFSNIS
jgi:hypothetical protein